MPRDRKLLERAWRTAAVLLVTVAGTGVALAAKDGSDARIEAQTMSGPGPAASAECGPGKRATGGGVMPVGAADGAEVVSSGPLDATGITEETLNGDKATQWFAHTRAADGRAYKVFAICSKRSDAKIRAQSFLIQDSGTTTVPCPNGQTAVGGGVLFDNGDAGDANVLRVAGSGPVDASGLAANTDDGDRPRQWLVAMENPTGPELDLTAFAICSKDSKAKIEATSFTIDHDQNDGQVAACGPGKRALGGGVLPVNPVNAQWVEASGPRDNSFSAGGTRNGDVPTQWYASVTAISGDDEELKVLAVCG